MNQDFTRRVSIVVNKDLPMWQVLNAVAHISAYFGNTLAGNFSTGDFFETKDGVQFPRNSQYAIIVLSAEASQLSDFAKTVRGTEGLESMSFIREMIDTTDDSEIIEALSNKDSNQVEILGVGLFGENQLVKEATKSFKLWK